MTAAEARKKSQEAEPRATEEELKAKLLWIEGAALNGKTNTSFTYLSSGCCKRLLGLGYAVSEVEGIYTVWWEEA